KPLPTVEEVRRLIGAPARERAEVPTLGEWLQEWLEAKTRLAAGTRRSYLGHITNHIAPAIGWVRLDRLHVGHVQALFEGIEEHNAHIRACRASEEARVRASVRGRRLIGTSTRHRIRATLRSALTAAVARPDLPVQVNAAAQVELESCPRVRPLVWTLSRVKHYEKTGRAPSSVMVWTPEQTAVFLR